jgi:hypothetical protein
VSELVEWIVRWRGWPASARFAFALAFCTLPFFHLAIKVFGRAAFARALKPSSGPQNSSAENARAIAAAVNAAARHTLPRVTCLPRTLFLWWYLRALGIASEMRIGVRVLEGRMDAHAWLEIGGRPVNDHLLIASDYAALNQPPCA